MPVKSTNQTNLLFKQCKARQKALAQSFCGTILVADRLVPFGPHSSFFSLIPEPLCVFGERLCDLAWKTVALKMSNLAEWSHVIDHAWQFGPNNGLNEPWGFVTEPYMPEDRAVAFCHLARDALVGWGVNIHLLTPDKSSWNPGQCRPIVACYSYSVESFYREPVKWLLEAVFPSYEEETARLAEE